MERMMQGKYEKLKEFYRNGFGGALTGLLGHSTMLIASGNGREKRIKYLKNEMKSLQELYGIDIPSEDDDFSEVSRIKELLPCLFGEIDYFLDNYQRLTEESKDYRNHMDRAEEIAQKISQHGENFRRRVQEYRTKLGIKKDVFFDSGVKRLSPPPK
ncbi:MAG: hypothetical protein NTY20_01315 [Candidatus Aenigmarchaeota archaeon]|nr:hypothetical protein [Candidatus Aenigmarchaeota archaeon]